jgi:hypothetical protein
LAGLAQAGVELCLEGLDFDLVVVDIKSVGKLEGRQRLFDGCDWHFELVQVVIGKALPVFGIAEVDCQCGERTSG